MWPIHQRGWGVFDHGYGGWGLVDDLLWILLLLGLLALVGVLIFRLLRNPSGSSSDRALQIARERYAKGEIDQAEFEALKRNLGA
ncbi:MULTISPECIES: SHOCT domain-containing protein [unclassified Meiothermus]|uniref:SHOCT domain-containing protein n=1 Tax=unclassified Meiothermus TaxID=370471 RepID=UPI000D7C62F1|nr:MULTISPECIES: SHOCT domain-containing protein [unclassified Meiothermus]PZA05816.1 SHOCT domain-containing protein [Meiothermus sp. Pnk-1]RYM29954.1 SHOCT domain-containing protein [Meiothermus sp. PNK-Is4]